MPKQSIELEKSKVGTRIYMKKRQIRSSKIGNDSMNTLNDKQNVRSRGTHTLSKAIESSKQIEKLEAKDTAVIVR